MNSRVDSIGFFVQQVAGHVHLLTELLTTNCDSAIDSPLIEKCLISTRMLANSMSLLDLMYWEELLLGYESLLLEYRDKDSCWDEKIAQITSELIEKEELLSNRPEDREWNPDSLVTPDEVRALATEVDILMSIACSNSIDSGGEPAEEPPGAEEVVEGPQGEEQRQEEPQGEEPREYEADAAGSMEEDRSDVVMSEVEKPEFIGGLISQLDISTGRLVKEWQAWKARLYDPTAFDIHKIKQDSYLIHFYALSLVEIAEMKNEQVDEPTLSTLEHLRVVLDLYAALLSERDGCRVDIGFLGEENMLDVALLFTAAKILKCMISDISRRSSESYLRIEIEVENRNGALWWCLRDNGNNFITDSRLDRDDFLAFYPGLREVKKQLEQFHGVLWVEPDEDHDRRFAFTMPLHANSQTFMVWRHGTGGFCMPALQVCAVLSSDEADIYREARGEYVTVEEVQVPLLRLSYLCSEAPETGKAIVVAGSLEKRIAFYAPDQGNTEDGKWRKIPVPAWNGLSSGVAEFGEEHVPVIEGSKIVAQYLATFGSSYNERMSGSIVAGEAAEPTDEHEVMERPEDTAAEGDVDVLVVEKSEAVRDALVSILSPTNLSVRMCDEASEIDQFLKKYEAAVIISDFRESSGAAKKIINSMRAAGRNIPVILSTTHTEDKASILASEIGAAGYFLKPLDSRKVLQILGRFVQIGERCAARE